MLTTILPRAQGRLQFQDLGVDHFDRSPPDAKARLFVARHTKLGFVVQRQLLADAA
jgi:hypothetical protein